MSNNKEDTSNEIIFSFHEQFAINQNHHQDILFKLLSIIGAVIVGYGYILHDYSKIYSFSEAVFGLIVSEILLIIGLSVVVISANSFRRDQNVCYRIRRKAELTAGKKTDEKKDDIFPYSFYPLKEKPGFFTWMPDFHQMFSVAFIIFQLLTGIVLIVKSVANKDFCDHSCLIIGFPLLSIIVSILILVAYTNKIKRLYNREQELNNIQ